MLLVNGEAQQQLPVSDRGLAYGDGVWETIAIKQGQPQLLEWHLQRLQHGLQVLGIVPVDWATLESEIYTLCNRQQRAVIKIIITRGSGGRGYNPYGCHQPTRIVQRYLWPSYPSHYPTDGIRLALCQTRLAAQPLLAGFKHLNRLEQVLARAEVGGEYQEGLVLDYADYVIEGTMSNLFVLQHNGQIVTPDLTYCGIAGIMQRFIQRSLVENGLECHIRKLTLHDLREAQSLFLTNSLIGIWPVREFLGKVYSIAPIIQTLQKTVDTIS